MNSWKKYKHLIIVLGILLWILAKLIGIQQWDSAILMITILLYSIDDIIGYAKKNGIKKFAILIGVFIIICLLTSLIFIKISLSFHLSLISKTAIIVLGLVIDLFIIGYTMKKLGTAI
ncbi:hypothetical protein IO99_11960 [Clostridium sulfidigenes]|uniref:Uncharacterized protein n=1 Tax=Clostridium sulfidigenes TaxID=318464 RepID=A0A084JA65_9CLOT|nr:hypothetical protein [Clostridium sulfidigenes]KEZ85849.1 hypothetical protein IO99_11960 [Clostridium sulfidigenes]